MTELAVVSNRCRLGTVTRSRGGDLSLVYDPEWWQDPATFQRDAGIAGSSKT